MILLLDTNIWIQELGLTTTKGAAVIFYIKQNNAKIALPEVVKLETEEILKQNVLKIITQIEKNHRLLLSIFGTVKEIVLPSEKEINDTINSIFSKLNVDILEIPFSFDSAKSSFHRLIKKIPPSQKNQQFKDCIIWENCIELLKTDEVLFVTRDTAFYEGNKFENGLHQSLIDEIKNSPNKLKIFSSLTDLLTDIEKDIELNNKFLFEEILRNKNVEIESILNDLNLLLSEDFSLEKKLFITKDANVLLLEFIIKIKCVEIENKEKTNVVVRIIGNCTFMNQEKRIEDIRLDEIKLIEIRDNVENNLKGIIYVSSAMSIGHRKIQHKVKYQIE